jgi:hypothetical protein
MSCVTSPDYGRRSARSGQVDEVGVGLHQVTHIGQQGRQGKGHREQAQLTELLGSTITTNTR